MGTAPKDAARVLLLEGHVLELLKAVNDEDRKAAATLADPGDKIVAKLGDVPLGKVEIRAGVKSAKVADRAELLAWIRENRPGMLTKPVDLGPLTEAIMAAQTDGIETLPALQQKLIVDAAYRQLGLAMREGAGAAVLSAGAERALLDNVKEHDGTWLDEATGETAELPGVVFDQGPPSVVVSLDRSHGAPEAVGGLLAAGQLPGMPAIEAAPAEVDQ